MQARMGTLEEGKDQVIPIRANQSRALPIRWLKFFLLFLGIAVVFTLFSMFMVRHLRLQNVAPLAQFRMQPCFQEVSSLESWIRPPTRLWHTMNDSELFWRASFVPQIQNYPFNRIPKIAFMFLTRGPLPMSPLWERFFNGHEGFYSIYIHSLPSYMPDFPSTSVFYGRQIPSQVAEWGEMTMCDAERRLLANALFDISNEWFVLLSEACIPLHNFSNVYEYLSGSQFSFMGSYDDPGPYGRGRYNGNMSPEVSLSDWRKGSQWFEVNRKLAVDIVRDTIYYPKFYEFCKPACYVDEHYFPTMLSIQSPQLLANRSLTWVDWSRGGAHPATFGKGDINKEFFRRIFEGETCTYNDEPTSVCFLFARKFAPSALDPLLQHASSVFGF